jgi:hypothetical protein
MRVRIVFGAALVFGIAALGCGKKEPELPPAPPQVPIAIGLPAPPGAPATDALKDETAKRLKQIGVAFHNHESANQTFPAGVVGPDGNLGLSWRVALLPYLEQGELYKQFKLNEPWDSEHNKKLLPKMPAVFAHPAKPSPEGNTHFRALAGHDAFIPLPHPLQGRPNAQHWGAQPGFTARGRAATSITDGTSNTLMVAEAADAVPWTKPDELLYQDQLVKGGAPKPGPVPKFGGQFPGGFHALMIDGKVVFFPDTFSETARRSIITVSRGEVDSEASAILWSVPPNEPPAPPAPKAPSAPVGVPETLPDAAARKVALANFQKIVFAAYEHHDAYYRLPTGYASAKGPGLSWRVAVLPYIGEEALFKLFKLDEPWDSENNKKFLEKMPKMFASAGKAAPAGHTFVRTTQGPGGVIAIPAVAAKVPEKIVKGSKSFPVSLGVELPKPGLPLFGGHIARFYDGTTNTLLFLEASESVPWTKPDELTIPYVSALGKGPFPVPELGGAFEGGFHAAFADGTVQFFKSTLPKDELAKLLTPRGGEAIDDRGRHAAYVAEPPKIEPKKTEPKTK